jgi:predicted RND superfamily exporter protein
MLRWLFKSIFNRSDMFVMVIILILTYSTHQWYWALFFFIWCGISGTIEKRLFKVEATNADKRAD